MLRVRGEESTTGCDGEGGGGRKWVVQSSHGGGPWMSAAGKGNPRKSHKYHSTKSRAVRMTGKDGWTVAYLPCITLH